MRRGTRTTGGNGSKKTGATRGTRKSYRKKRLAASSLTQGLAVSSIGEQREKSTRMYQSHSRHTGRSVMSPGGGRDKDHTTWTGPPRQANGYASLKSGPATAPTNLQGMLTPYRARSHILSGAEVTWGSGVDQATTSRERRLGRIGSQLSAGQAIQWLPDSTKETLVSASRENDRGREM